MSYDTAAAAEDSVGNNGPVSSHKFRESEKLYQRQIKEVLRKRYAWFIEVKNWNAQSWSEYLDDSLTIFGVYDAVKGRIGFLEGSKSE